MVKWTFCLWTRNILETHWDFNGCFVGLTLHWFETVLLWVKHYGLIIYFEKFYSVLLSYKGRKFLVCKSFHLATFWVLQYRGEERRGDILEMMIFSAAWWALVSSITLWSGVSNAPFSSPVISQLWCQSTLDMTTGR